MHISKNVRDIAVVLGTIVAAVLLVYFVGRPAAHALLYVLSLLSPILFGYLFSLLINPIADRLHRRMKIPRGVSAVTVIILVLAVCAVVIGVLGYRLIEEVKNLYHQWPTIVASFDAGWEAFKAKWSTMYLHLPNSMQSVMDDLKQNISDSATKFMGNTEIVDGAQNFAKSLPGGTIWTIIFVVTLYFMVSQKEHVNAGIRRILGERIVNKLKEIKRECKVYLGGYVRAQIILMFVIMIVIAIALAVLQAPFYLLVAVITAILDALPVFGSGLVLGPMAIVYFISGNLKLGFGYIAVYLIVTLLRRILEPKLVSDKMGLSPIFTLAVMYIGYRWWGLIGMLTGPILFMAVMSLYKVGLFTQPIRILNQLAGFFSSEIKMFARYLDTLTRRADD